ncbi:MAG: tetratricopeptide repeat protein [Gammaproteobacteria bacterium]|nr:tetratricopeptide repeat protein [Gammaproteobacteria bacterium]MDH3431231.1 tetratricopeptide repeat protein [Gammaproteobacteria bacterium]
MTSISEDALTAEQFFERAIDCHQRGDIGEARSNYLRVIEMLPDHADALHFLGVACYQGGDAEDAEKYIKAAIGIRPDNRDYYSNLGLVLRSTGRYDEAIDAFSFALTLDPDFADGLNNLGSTYLVAGLEDDAETVFRRLLAMDPDHVEGCNNLAVLLGKYSPSKEARALYEHALHLNPDYADAHANCGRMLSRSDEFDSAIEHFQAAVKLDDSNAALHRELGETLLKSGRLDEAMAACERALKLAHDDPDCHVSVGNVYLSRDQLPEAEACYQRALGLDPDNARAICNIGNIFMRNADVEAALDCFGRAIEQNPGFVEAMYNKGTALQKLGRLAEAAGHFGTALAHNPRIPSAYRYLAEIYRLADMRESQLEVLHRWLEIYPESPTARHLLMAATQEEVTDRASDDFVREEFDAFADAYEETLAELDYKAPELISDLLQGRFHADSRSLVVLDAGCGTGLCAPFLNRFCRELHGVDLSGKMIALADRRKLYDELTVAELTDFMTTHQSRYDLIVSADTLSYFGSLDTILAAAAAALKAQASIAFSVELLARDAGQDFRLNASGRYAHSEDYIGQCMLTAGFEVDVLQHAVLRTEMQQPVDGLIVLGHLGEAGSQPS